jgi:TRAP-type mannitol/chloroaromatic compound transport system permease large subunit
MNGNILSAGQAALVLFGVFVGLLIVRVPVAFALGLACLPILLIEPRLSMMMLAQETFNAYNSFILLSVPFFLLTANLMSIGGITDRLVALSRSMVGHWPGSIAGADQCRAFGVLRRHLRLIDGGRGEPVENLHRCPEQGGL